MPRLTVNDVQQLAEPIIIEAGVLTEKEYRLEKITTELMKKVNEVSPKKGESKDTEVKGDVEVVIKQLALLLNVPVTEFADVDLRVGGKVLTFISEEITKGVKDSNPTPAEAK